MKVTRTLAFGTFIAAVVAAPAPAALNVDFVEVGGDVVATLSGSFDYNGMGPKSAGTAGAVGGFLATVAIVQFSGLVDYYGFVSGPPDNFGTGGAYTSSVGDAFFRRGTGVGVPQGYVAGDPLSASMTFSSSTFASLGLTPGTYVWNYPNDTITLNIGVANNAVPEPGTWAMMLMGFGAMGWSFKRRRKLAFA